MGIKIELAELQRIATRTQDIEGELSTDLAKMTSQLSDICANVQSSELTAANDNLTRAINDIASKVSTNLPRIIEFLNAQIVNYARTNEETKSKIDSLVSAVNSSIQGDQ